MKLGCFISSVTSEIGGYFKREAAPKGVAFFIGMTMKTLDNLAVGDQFLYENKLCIKTSGKFPSSDLVYSHITVVELYTGKLFNLRKTLPITDSEIKDQ